jgi:hypothetical protein
MVTDHQLANQLSARAHIDVPSKPGHSARCANGDLLEEQTIGTNLSIGVYDDAVRVWHQ